MITKKKHRGGYRTLIAWQEAKQLAVKVYDLTEEFPSEERYHLVQQMRRAATSIMANLAEGSAMPTKVHRNAFYARARGSAIELDSFVELCLSLRLVQQVQCEDFTSHISRITFLITKLINCK
jgi:four helix bundle protein